MEEAARVDGATKAQAFRLILLPLAAPALFTTAIIAFITTWNEFMLARQLSTTATEPVTVAIARFSGPSAFEYPYAATMAAGALVTIPLIIMVLIFQHRIVAGLTAGGVKGLSRKVAVCLGNTILNRPSSYGIPDWDFLGL